MFGCNILLNDGCCASVDGDSPTRVAYMPHLVATSIAQSRTVCTTCSRSLITTESPQLWLEGLDVSLPGLAYWQHLFWSVLQLRQFLYQWVARRSEQQATVKLVARNSELRLVPYPESVPYPQYEGQ